MVVAGCDVGSLTAEAVILKGGSIIASEIIRVRPRPEQSAQDVMNAALAKAGLAFDDIAYCISTGYGRDRIPFAHDNVSEISCHGKGAQFLIPSVRTVIDIGGQDCKAISVNEKGELVNFIMNDKCAAGTGRFLEQMSKTLGLTLEGLSALPLGSDNPLPITSLCSIFIDTEVLCYVNDGADLADITAGINQAMAVRVKALVARIGVMDDVCITGGVAKNSGVVKSLAEMLGIRIHRMPEDPQIIGALGAALIASERVAYIDGGACND